MHWLLFFSAASKKVNYCSNYKYNIIFCWKTGLSLQKLNIILFFSSHSTFEDRNSSTDIKCSLF